MKPIWIFSLALPAVLAGCAHDFGERLDDLAISRENRRYAARAWDAVEPIYEHVAYEDDFEEGFKDGYVVMAETGVDTPPLIPPRKYWTAHYRTAEGHRRARAWFDGFAHGSLAAEHDGIAHWNRIPISTPGLGPAAVDATLAPPALGPEPIPPPPAPAPEPSHPPLILPAPAAELPPSEMP